MQHIKSAHLGHRYECEFCDNIYTRKDILKHHVKSLHEGQRQKCIFCGKIYGKITDLQKHVNDMHIKAVNVNQDVLQSESFQQEFSSFQGIYLCIRLTPGLTTV